jgi:hypothetical protein
MFAGEVNRGEHIGQDKSLANNLRNIEIKGQTI